MSGVTLSFKPGIGYVTGNLKGLCKQFKTYRQPLPSRKQMAHGYPQSDNTNIFIKVYTPDGEHCSVFRASDIYKCLDFQGMRNLNLVFSTKYSSDS